MSRRWEWAGQDIPGGQGPWPRTLQTVWAPLIELTEASERHPVKLRNIEYLLARQASPVAAESPRSFPLASYLSPPGMRQWLALRAGRTELGFARLPLSAALPLQWKALQEMVRTFRSRSPHSKAWIVSALSQLTLYEDVLKLAQGLEFDVDRTADAALAYEIGRAVQRLDIRHSLPPELFEQILRSKADAYLRVACAIQFMVRGGRFERNAAMAKRASERGERLLKAEYSRPRDPFRHALMCSRFFRADALVSVIHGGPRTPGLATRLARDWHDRAQALCGDDPEQQQLVRENKRLVVEAALKLATHTGDPLGATFAQELLDVDGEDPDCLAFAGDYWAARGHWRQACALYLGAMRRGTVRGVISALAAGDLLAANGLKRQATQAYRHALALDARSITARQRLGHGRTQDEAIGVAA